MTTSPTKYQLLPCLPDDEYELLKQDIKENGIRVPIDVDEDGVILDGHHRARVAADLGITYPQRVVTGLTDQQKRDHALAVNTLRRHLTRDARREHVAQMRAEGQSIRAMAQTLGVPKSTISDDVAQVSGTGQVTFRVVGTDGKQYPSAPAASSPRRRDLTDTASSLCSDLLKLATRLGKIRDDDRLIRNRERLALMLCGDLGTAIRAAQDLFDALSPQGPGGAA